MRHHVNLQYVGESGGSVIVLLHRPPLSAHQSGGSSNEIGSLLIIVCYAALTSRQDFNKPCSLAFPFNLFASEAFPTSFRWHICLRLKIWQSLQAVDSIDCCYKLLTALTAVTSCLQLSQLSHAVNSSDSWNKLSTTVTPKTSYRKLCQPLQAGWQLLQAIGSFDT